VELMTQEDCTRSLVRFEECFDGDPKLTHVLFRGTSGEVEDAVGDGAVDPTADAVVCHLPC
jgi:hypothetical protein